MNTWLGYSLSPVSHVPVDTLFAIRSPLNLSNLLQILLLGRAYEINNLICLFYGNQLCFSGYFECHLVTIRAAKLALNHVVREGLET